MRLNRIATKNKQTKLHYAAVMVLCLIAVGVGMPNRVLADSDSQVAVESAEDVSTVALNKTKATIYVGKSLQLELTGSSGSVTWKSSDKSLATVSSTGKVTGVSKGTVTIKAKADGKTYKCVVTVKKAQLNKKSIDVSKKGTFQLKLNGAKAVSWSSKDKSVATVSKDGVVTGKKTGVTTITCTDKKGKKYKCQVSVGLDADSIYKAMISKKKKYPEGMSWTNDNHYSWNGGIYSRGSGCSGFAFMLSDAAFGSLPARMHTDYDNIRVGDILRINYDTHSVIVLEVNEDSVIVAEGNYNSSIHWGREISISEIKETGKYVMTRYPE
jgi:uncharacterized protein YjdB